MAVATGGRNEQGSPDRRHRKPTRARVAGNRAVGARAPRRSGRGWTPRGHGAALLAVSGTAQERCRSARAGARTTDACRLHGRPKTLERFRDFARAAETPLAVASFGREAARSPPAAGPPWTTCTRRMARCLCSRNTSPPRGSSSRPFCGRPAPVRHRGLGRRTSSSAPPVRAARGRVRAVPATVGVSARMPRRAPRTPRRPRRRPRAGRRPGRAAPRDSACPRDRSASARAATPRSRRSRPAGSSPAAS